MSKKKLNAFDQLVKWFDDGTITPTLLQIAYRVHIRHSKVIPEKVKDILAGKSDANAGVVYTVFGLVRQIIGSVELAYRRGDQKDDVEINQLIDLLP